MVSVADLVDYSVLVTQGCLTHTHHTRAVSAGDQYSGTLGTEAVGKQRLGAAGYQCMEALL